ncbi:MAG: RQC domain protein [ANME-2 cluster archaeon HR1]|jgi:hypothetical protein|nr:MAG: RQC domain protein [ANME-2 cluster archaeon HR1]
MSKRAKRVPYTLDPKGISTLPIEELTAILRGADDLIMSGGRNLLAKILKGSRQKKLLELKLDQSPVYGYYQDLSLEDVLARIDWVIVNGYLDIKYDYRLPLLDTPEGWEIEKDTYSTELLRRFDDVLKETYTKIDMNFLKDMNRQIILLLLDKIQATEDVKYIPLLKAWQEIDYKKVRKRIAQVIFSIEKKHYG